MNTEEEVVAKIEYYNKRIDGLTSEVEETFEIKNKVLAGILENSKPQDDIKYELHWGERTEETLKEIRKLKAKRECATAILNGKIQNEG